jgi:hypothetical protein
MMGAAAFFGKTGAGFPCGRMKDILPQDLRLRLAPDSAGSSKDWKPGRALCPRVGTREEKLEVKRPIRAQWAHENT